MEADRGGERQQGDPPRRRRRWLWGVLIAAAILLLLLLLTAGVIAAVLVASSGGSGGGGEVAREVFQEEYVSGEGENKIAVLPVVGVISSQETTDALGTPSATPQTLQDEFDQAAEDEDVRAVILEVDSPGGGVVPSAEMRQIIEDFRRESDKPVIVSMGNTAASGGYYIATAADSVVANPGTITGSLGVIISILNYEEAEEKLGLKQETVKSGEFKDIGSPSDPFTQEERAIFQGLVDESYADFVRVIVEGRDLPEDRVRELADGRVYSGLQAEELGLVDELGNLDAAARVSRELAGIDEATVVRYASEPTLVELLQARLTATPESEAMKILETAGYSPTPELQYLYKP